MIETTIPEINVTELMEQVRAESTRPRPLPPRQASGGATPALPPVARLPATPEVWIPGAVKSTKERLSRLLETARAKNEGGSRFPKFLRRFFRKQGGYNRAVLDGLAALSKSNDQLTQRVTEISHCLEHFNSWLLALHEQSDADSNWMKAAAPGVSRIERLGADVDLIENHLQSIHDNLHELWTERGNAAKRVAAVESGTKERLAAIESETRERLTALESGTKEHLAAVEAGTKEQVATLGASTDDRIAEVRGAIEQIQHETKANAEATITALEQVRTDWARVEEQTRSLRTELEAAGSQLRLLRTDVDNAGLHLRNLQAQTDGIGQQLAATIDKTTASLARRDQDKEDLQQQIERASLHLRNLQAQADRLGVHINNLQGFVDTKTAETNAIHHGMEQRLSDQAGLAQRIVAFEERTIADAALVKGELAEYGALFRRLLGDRLEEPTAGGKNNNNNDKSAHAAKRVVGLDSLYVAFENRFRGPRDVIKKRVEFYLPFVRKSRAGTAGRPILDVGCGRGEWLELLKEHKLEGRGVDLNTAMVSLCKARGLKVEAQDALDYLRSLRAGSLGAVTGFHIIEHLPFETLIELFRQARRVLKPGGVAIFESPNCKNLIVGACNFHIDPTHRQPVFPGTAELILGSQGFEKIRIEYLSPVPNVKFNANTPELATIKDLLYGPQDFGIIAYKPRR